MIDKIFLYITRFSTLFVIFIVAWIFVVLFEHSMEAFNRFGFDFILKDEWVPNLNQFGAKAAILGSILSTFLAMLISIPIALGVAIFLSEIAPSKIRAFFGVSIELLVAIPSVIYGMWGLFFFVPILRDIFGGAGIGLLTAGIVLAIMILPFVAAISRDAMNTTPDILKESAYALGATKLNVIKDITITYAKAGIIGSIVLGLGRAIGETMAVTFVMGNAHRLPSSITDPTTSIPVTLANEFTEANSSLYFSSLFALTFVLLIMSFIIIATAKFYFLQKVRKS